MIKQLVSTAQLYGVDIAISFLTLGGFWILLKMFGDKWLAAIFRKQIEEIKSEHQKKMEGVRFEFAKQMDRKVKIHEHEYEVVPNMWEMLVEAFNSTKHADSSIITIPFFKYMSKEELDDFLKDASLQSWQKTELRKSKNKEEYYLKCMNLNNITEAKTKAQLFDSYMKKKGILIQPSMLKKFRKLNDLIFSALMEKEFNLEDRQGRNNGRELSDVGGRLLDELEEDIQKQLGTA